MTSKATPCISTYLHVLLGIAGVLVCIHVILCSMLFVAASDDSLVSYGLLLSASQTTIQTE